MENMISFSAFIKEECQLAVHQPKLHFIQPSVYFFVTALSSLYFLHFLCEMSFKKLYQ